MTPKTLNRTNSKRPEEFFTLDLFLQSVLEFYLVKCFYQNIQNILFQAIFQQKKKELSPVLGGVLVYSGQPDVIYDFQATNKSVVGEGGLSQGVLPASYRSPVSHL
jgi:hypothetical protein